ncbi:MAG: [FeFe] hydrogenase large subuni [Candidatus Ozemobacter sibiricus]|jgi:iron-only hydrogenase group A|uniref:[FeFe] hydrogenase large subuni n=1 Tax=Candidatus Ozemobacter sibiricus TaxID=2268124 RepID=A0A367ZPA3_9BACT|nr:MAG: [FeFe] hydrogenase large subuni [Candidatus Ozemobacter sibiricus]
MMNVEINGTPCSFEPGLTILDACRKIGVDIPTLCHLKGLNPSGSCRICVVEVDGARSLVPACAHPLTEGMKIRTNTDRIRDARKLIVELLIANHPQDCLTCSRSLTCELQKLAQELGAEPRPQFKERRVYPIDASSPALVRDANKCIICGRCVRVCEEIQGIGAIDFTKRGFQTMVLPAFNEDLANTTCVNCGQCIKVCPTGALTENFAVRDVIDALSTKGKTVVAQIAPAVRVALGELFGVDEDNVAPLLVNALRRIGFAYVFDTNFAADLTIMEEGTELVERLTKGGVLPMITSCSPGWIKFIEHFFPHFLPNLSTCKSPQQMQGAMIKGYWAKRMNLDPRQVHVVSLMPCTAKKFEAQRPEMEVDGIRDVDTVLTTREVARLLKAYDVDLKICQPEPFDHPLGESSGAGAIFGATGGVAEAALRTAHKLVTGQEMANLNIEAVRGFTGIKEATIALGDLKLRIAVVSGLANARQVLQALEKGERQYDFIEIMACPGGCLNGGGQPTVFDVEALQKRLAKIYAIDAGMSLRRSHDNPSIKKLYADFLERPNSSIAHHYLHTHYHARQEQA